MDPDQKYYFFLNEWAKSKGFTLIIDACDGRESSDLIDGMAVDDVWCWLLPNGITQKRDEFYGCIEWSLENSVLQLKWKTYDFIAVDDQTTNKNKYLHE